MKDPETKKYLLAIKKIYQELGWKASIGIEEGLGKLY